MPALFRLRAVGRAALAVTGTLVLAAAPAHAQPFALLMEGTLDGRSGIVAGGVTTPFTGVTPFTLEAYFDVSSPNLVAPIPVPGFVAYRPTSIQLTVGGRTYAMQSYDAANPLGVAVAIFDNTTPFGPPNRYGVGIIQDPLADGSGFVADYGGASPAFAIGSTGIIPTTFTQYYGVGVTSGVCTVGNPGAGCQQFAVTPIPMTWQGQSFALSLGSYEEDLAPGGTPFTARIVAAPAQVVPEPATVALVGAGVAVLGLGARRRRTA
jgi:hypothetical protein